MKKSQKSNASIGLHDCAEFLLKTVTLQQELRNYECTCPARAPCAPQGHHVVPASVRPPAPPTVSLLSRAREQQHYFCERIYPKVVQGGLMDAVIQLRKDIGFGGEGSGNAPLDMYVYRSGDTVSSYVLDSAK